MRRKKTLPLNIDELLDLYEAVREMAQHNVDNHPPVPTLEEETKRLWIRTLQEQHGIPEEDALELLKEMPKAVKLAEMCKAVS